MTGWKILSLEMLLARLVGHRRCLDRIVFTNGCFDLFHAGHLATLEAARLLGDVLVVAVNSDASGGVRWWWFGARGWCRVGVGIGRD